jgi:translation initiation factor 2B subunit (eIF-2B alpha/beta/delta family)
LKSSAKNKLTKILSDNKSGSTEILLNLINWCRSNSKDKKVLKEMTSVVSKEFKSFSNVQSFIKGLSKIIKSKDESQVTIFLKQQEESIVSRYKNLFLNSLHYLKDAKKIATISNSKTISEILVKLNKHHEIYVIIGESRPQFEGRVLAKELLKNKIKIEIMPDALLFNIVEISDAVVIGADTILANGNVVNKIGSRGLAIACKHFKKPFYVLAASDKFSNRKKYHQEKKSGTEIWNYNHQLLKRTNYYFEVVEKKLITKVIRD